MMITMMTVAVKTKKAKKKIMLLSEPLISSENLPCSLIMMSFKNMSWRFNIRFCPKIAMSC